MKTMFFALACLLSPLAHADSDDCLSEAAVKSSYDSCISLLKMSPADQATIAKKTGYTLQQVLDACNLQKKKGLQGMIDGNQEYCDESQAPSFPNAGTCYSEPGCSGSPTPAPWGSIGCGSMDHSYQDSDGSCSNL